MRYSLYFMTYPDENMIREKIAKVCGKKYVIVNLKINQIYKQNAIDTVHIAEGEYDLIRNYSEIVGMIAK